MQNDLPVEIAKRQLLDHFQDESSVLKAFRMLGKEKTIITPKVSVTTFLLIHCYICVSRTWSDWQGLFLKYNLSAYAGSKCSQLHALRLEVLWVACLTVIWPTSENHPTPLLKLAKNRISIKDTRVTTSEVSIWYHLTSWSFQMSQLGVLTTKAH